LHGHLHLDRVPEVVGLGLVIGYVPRLHLLELERLPRLHHELFADREHHHMPLQRLHHLQRERQVLTALLDQLLLLLDRRFHHVVQERVLVHHGVEAVF